MKTTTLRLVFYCFFITNISYSQVGKPFPLITGETLNSKKITVPTDTKGKRTLIGLAYSQKAEKTLQNWLNPIYNEFIEKPEKPVLFDFSYDIYIYFIPMFVGANQSFAETAKKRMASQLDKELAPHVLIYKGELGGYSEELKMKKDDIPYFFVLDESGKIIHTTSGNYTDNKLEKLIDHLDW